MMSGRSGSRVDPTTKRESALLTQPSRWGVPSRRLLTILCASVLATVGLRATALAATGGLVRFLVRNGEQDAFFWNGGFDASFVPYATSNFTPRLTYEQNFFRYNRFSRLDFDSNSLNLDLRYDLNRSGSWFIDGSVDIGRLYSPRSSADAFYKFGFLDGSISNIRPLGQTSIYLASTAGINWRVGNPSAFDRIDPYLNLALTYSPFENIFLGAFLRPEVRFYTNDPIKSSRTDFDLLVGANVSWTPVKYLALGATVSFTDNFSNSGPAEYDVVTPALVLSARIAF